MLREEFKMTSDSRRGPSPVHVSGCYPQFQIGPIGVWVQHGPMLPPL